MARLDISRSARADLQAIDEYGLEHFGESAANALQDGIRQAFVMLCEYPQSSPERPDYGEDVRCKMHRGYRILYRIGESSIIILRVVHHSRGSHDLIDS